jgi:glyoxylase-like metal-dependent hydrolase (beta-lactamase superfamily II)
MNEIVPGIYTWSVASEAAGLVLNGYVVRAGRASILIDPPGPGAEGWAMFDRFVPYEGVYVSDRNHGRDASLFRDHFDVPVCIHKADADRAEVDADELLRGGELVCGSVRVVHVPGRSPGEVAFHTPERDALILGGFVAGAGGDVLDESRPAVLDDVDEYYRSAERLLELSFDALLLCDGEPVPTGGKELLRRFVAARPG